MFMNTVQGPYWERTMGVMSFSFYGLVTIGDCIDNVLRGGKFQDTLNSQPGREENPDDSQQIHNKKKRKIWEASQTPPSVPSHNAPAVQNQQPWVNRRSRQHSQGHTSQNQPRGPHQGGRNNKSYVAAVAPIMNQPRAQVPKNNYQFRDKVSVDPIPMLYSQLYPALIQRGLVTPRGYKSPPPNSLSAWYNLQQHCEFHEGAPGHDIDNCYALKIRVQELINAGILSFKDAGPNVKTNLMPNREDTSTSREETDQLNQQF